MNAKGKPIPSLPSDEAAEHFVATADLSSYDLSGFKPVRFDITKKAPALSTRLPVTPPPRLSAGTARRQTI